MTTKNLTGKTTERGFTMIEMSIVMTVLVPLLVGIALTTSSVNSTMEANSRRADVTTRSRRHAGHARALSRWLSATSSISGISG